MDWIPIAWRAFGARAEITRLVDLLRPTINEFRKVAPDVIALARIIMSQITPEAQAQFDADVEHKRDLYWLQTSLNKLGEQVIVDGQYGPATAAAIKRFQAKHGLTVDGWAGIETTAAIYGALSRSS